MDNEEIKKENNEPLEKSLNDALNDDNFQDVEFVESTEDGESLPTKDVAKKLREDLKTCRKEKEEYLTGWQRAKADYVNLQRELDLARANTSVIAKEKMVEKLLPALDSFEMAFGNKEHFETLDKEWRMGITSIHSQLLKGLEDSGIEKIDEQNVPFDPNIHQSISVVHTDDETKDHTVEKVLQIGYKIGDRVIRPAKVTIYDHKKIN
jgi:molecular chaperone GrpE